MYGIVLAGGSGTRLWPLSRERLPKQCIKIGSGELSLFQEAVARLQGAVSREHFIIVTHRDQKDLIALQLAELNINDAVILEEPQALNTGPAIGLAAWYLAAKDPRAIMVVLPSDHYIAPRRAFQDLLAPAGRLAEKYGLVTLGIRPDYPETGYGYIKCGRAVEEGGSRVAAFVEKPEYDLAQEYLAAGNYLWNSGIFVFQVKRLLAEYRRHLPEIARALDGLEYNDHTAVEHAYSIMPKISIDYGILEKAEEIAVLPAAFTWSDLGSWEAYHRVSPRDNSDNHLKGKVTAVETHGSLILAHSRRVCAVGLRDMVVVDTPDALLVCPRDRSQEVRQVVEQLQKEKAAESLFPTTEVRPWGRFTVLAEGDNYKVKEINVYPGKRLSLQRHQHRAEQWTVVNGRALVTLNDEQHTLYPGDSISIPRLALHRVENMGANTLAFIEVQNGDYLGEDDIERFADDFGRAPETERAEEDGVKGKTASTRAQRLYNRWLASTAVDDPTKQELRSFYDDKEEIERRFGGDLSFGTGGLRGVIGVGSKFINTYVVRRATQGFANYINSRFSSLTLKKVAIAYDSRRFSAEFARETALVLAANGIKALLFSEMRPTPQLSFAIRELGCQGGIVVTASHNPSEYNGYKVYGEDGGQIVPHRAAKITAEINKVDYFNDVRLISHEEALRQELLEYLGKELDHRYLEQVQTLSQRPGDANFKIVYTPLHGTGIHLIPRLLQKMGYNNVYTVAAQANPDPAFPTVKAPNPEERDSFNLALELAAAKEAELVLATDPDADRIGCAVRNGEGKYVLLDGNQMGALLIDYLLGCLKRKNALPANGVIVKTIVTGNLGREIASSYGIPTEETLTGFKFIGEKIEEYEKQKDRRFLFGYEESYGYLAGTFVRDKDAIIAAVLIAEMAAYHQQRGNSLPEALEELYRRHGYYREELVYLDLPEQQSADQLLGIFSDDTLREFGGIKILEIRDYRQRIAHDLRTKQEHPLDLPISDVLFFSLENGSWFCIRPSGTEPKVKFYFAVQAGSAAAAKDKMNRLKQDILQRARQG